MEKGFTGWIQRHTIIRLMYERTLHTLVGLQDGYKEIQLYIRWIYERTQHTLEGLQDEYKETQL